MISVDEYDENNNDGIVEVMFIFVCRVESVTKELLRVGFVDMEGKFEGIKDDGNEDVECM